MTSIDLIAANQNTPFEGVTIADYQFAISSTEDNWLDLVALAETSALETILINLGV